MENEKSIGKYFIIKDLNFSDFMKNEKGIILFNSYEEASRTCGMYEFENVLICKVENNYKD